MARPSRPPGFDMTYRPTEEFFGPPWLQRIPSVVHLALALAVAVLVLVVRRGPTDSDLFRYMFREAHFIPAEAVVIAFAVSSIAGFLRSGMRGVRVRSDFVEYRDMMSGVVPKVRRIRWAQIDRVHLLSEGIILDLWDGRREALPSVRDFEGLGVVLERVALARAIPVEGGQGLDDLADREDWEQRQEA